MLVPPAPRSPHDLSSIAGEVGDEVGLPHVVAGAHRDEVALAGEVLALAGAVAELEIGVEDEFLVVERVHHQRQVGGGDEQRALAAAGVEMAVLGVERDGEQAARAPLEAALLAVGELDLRAAGAFEHVVDVLVEVALRRGRAAGRDVEHEHVGEIAAALEVQGRALDAVARPMGGRHREAIDAEVLGHREALALDPVEIGVDAVAGLVGFAHRFLHDRLFRRVGTARYTVHPRGQNRRSAVPTRTVSARDFAHLLLTRIAEI